MNFGDFTIPDDVSYWETLITQSVSGSIPAGQKLQYSVAQITMPWSGYVSAALHHTGNYSPGVMAVSCWPYGSPGPTQVYAGSMLEVTSPGGAWMTIPYMAQWISLAKGTVVNLGMEVQCNIGNVNWNASSINGCIRVFRD